MKKGILLIITIISLSTLSNGQEKFNISQEAETKITQQIDLLQKKYHLDEIFVKRFTISLKAFESSKNTILARFTPNTPEYLQKLTQFKEHKQKIIKGTLPKDIINAITPEDLEKLYQ